MSFLEQLKSRRKKLIPTSTVVTTATGERFLETNQTKIKLENKLYGFVEDTKPDKIPAEILKNFLFLGSQDAVSLENIKFYKLTHILSIGINVPLKMLECETELEIDQKYLPLLDLPETKLFDGDFMNEAFEFIKKARSKDERVLVHCNAGVSRSASVVIAYLMAHENMSFENAHNLVKSKRECIQPNAGFIQQLRQFNHKIA